MKKFEEEFDNLMRAFVDYHDCFDFDTEKCYLELKKEFIEKYGKRQQPEIPEFVAEYAQDCERELSYILEEIYLDTDYLEDHSTRNEREGLIARYWLYNRTVAKEKRFYLKHIDMSKKYNSTVCVLAHGEGDVIYGHYEFPVGVFPSESDYIFTQSQINSMETGSYEQIKIEVEK